MIDLKTTRISTLVLSSLILSGCGEKFRAFNLTLSSAATPTRSPGHVAPATMPLAVAELPAYPNLENTGVPPGTGLKASGAITVSVPGTVIDSLDIKGMINITADNVTIRRSKITVGGF